MESFDAYEVLGVPRDAGAEDIRRAYFRCVRDNPPERDAAAFRRIRAAYDRLRNEAERAQVDLSIVTPTADPVVERPPAYAPRSAEVARLLRDTILRSLSDLDRTDFVEDERPLPGGIVEERARVAS